MRRVNIRRYLSTLFMMVLLLIMSSGLSIPAQAMSYGETSDSTIVSLCPVLGCKAGNVRPSRLQPFFIGDVRTSYQVRTIKRGKQRVTQVKFEVFTIRRQLGRGETTATVSVNAQGLAAMTLTGDSKKYVTMLALQPAAWRDLPLKVHLVITQSIDGRSEVMIRDTTFKI